MQTHDRDVVITGRGVLSNLGDTPTELFEALCRGDSGLSTDHGFEASTDLPAGRIDFEPRTYLPEGNLRPLDRTGQLVVAAAQRALVDGGWPSASKDDSEGDEAELGLVLGTMYGSVHTIAAFDERALVAGPKYVKPFDFANSVINAAAGQAAIWHQLRGVNSTITGGTTAGLQALAYAVDAIRQGRAEALLAGGADELCFESLTAFGQAGLLAGSRNGAGPKPIPFDPERNGFALGEGAALLLLESAASAERRGARILGRIRGHAALFDVAQGDDPEAAGDLLDRVVRLALDDAGLDPGDVTAVSASANGSPTLDLTEARGLSLSVGESPALGVPITAIKGQLGECLGASGGLQALVLLESLRRGRLPGIAGCDPGAADVDLALATDTQRLEAANGPGLVTAVGLDGNLCALVLEGVGDDGDRNDV